MRRGALFLIVALTCALPAHADRDPRAPFLVGAFEGSVDAYGRASLRCSVPADAQMESDFESVSYRTASGSGWSQAAGSQLTGGGIFVEAGGQNVIVGRPNRDGFPGGGFEWNIWFGAEPGAITLVWAMWGGGGDGSACTLSVDGASQQWRALDPPTAIHLGPSDWADGAAAHAATVGVEVARTYQRNATGRLFGLMSADAGVLQLTKPDGANVTAPGISPRLPIMTNTPGAWTCTAVLTAGEAEELNLWLVEVPS